MLINTLYMIGNPKKKQAKKRDNSSDSLAKERAESTTSKLVKLGHRVAEKGDGQVRPSGRDTASWQRSRACTQDAGHNNKPIDGSRPARNPTDGR